MIFRYRRFFILISLFTASCAVLFGQSPLNKRWEEFISIHHGQTSLPDDEKMGKLADIRKRDVSWEGAWEACETVFNAVEEGQVPSEVFYKTVELPLKREFLQLLEAGSREADRCYGLPERNEDRVTLPIRLSIDDRFEYGHVYLILEDTNWFVEQWALDLSKLPVTEVPAEADDPSSSTETLVPAASPDDQGTS